MKDYTSNKIMEKFREQEILMRNDYTYVEYVD